MHPDDEVTGPVFGGDGHLAESAAHAFVDGALSDADGARVVLHLAECARCANLVAEARGLAAAASGIVRRLDDGPGARAVLPTRASGGAAAVVVAPGTASRRRSEPGREWRAGLRAAATVLVALGIGGSAYVVSRGALARDGVANPERAIDVASTPSPMAAAPVAVAPAAPAPAAAVPTASPTGAARTNAGRAGPGSSGPRQAFVAPRATEPAWSSPMPAPVDRNREAYALAPSPRVLASEPGAARGVVVGQVRDATSRPIAGTTVFVPGTPLRTTTDDSGRFVLRGVPAGDATLRARRSGFGIGTATVAVAPVDTARAAFTLDAEALSLSQVVVTGADGAPVAGSAASGTAARSTTPRADGMGPEIRARRFAKVDPSPAGCYGVTVSDTSRATMRRLPSSWQLDATGRATAGTIRGLWTIGDDSVLVVTWREEPQSPLAFRRDGTTWIGTGTATGIRLTRSHDAECTVR